METGKTVIVCYMCHQLSSGTCNWSYEVIRILFLATSCLVGVHPSLCLSLQFVISLSMCVFFMHNVHVCNNGIYMSVCTHCLEC